MIDELTPPHRFNPVIKLSLFTLHDVDLWLILAVQFGYVNSGSNANKEKENGILHSEVRQISAPSTVMFTVTYSAQ